MLKDASGYGCDVSVNGFSWSKLVEVRERYISNINEWYIGYLADDNIDVVRGRARFVDKHTLDVDGQRISADTPAAVSLTTSAPARSASTASTAASTS